MWGRPVVARASNAMSRAAWIALIALAAGGGLYWYASRQNQEETPRPVISNLGELAQALALLMAQAEKVEEGQGNASHLTQLARAVFAKRPPVAAFTPDQLESYLRQVNDLIKDQGVEFVPTQAEVAVDTPHGRLRLAKGPKGLRLVP